MTCTVLWTFHTNSTDETSCFETSAFTHQVTFLLISNITLFLRNSTFPLSSLSKIRLLSVQRAASQWQTVVCKVKMTLFVHLWGPAEWRVAELRQSSAAGGQLRLVRRGGWSSSLLQPERGPGRGPAIWHDPWLSTALPSHPAARCQTQLPACDSPGSWTAFRILWELLPGAVM